MLGFCFGQGIKKLVISIDILPKFRILIGTDMILLTESRLGKKSEKKSGKIIDISTKNRAYTSCTLELKIPRKYQRYIDDIDKISEIFWRFFQHIGGLDFDFLTSDLTARISSYFNPTVHISSTF